MSENNKKKQTKLQNGERKIKFYRKIIFDLILIVFNITLASTIIIGIFMYVGYRTNFVQVGSDRGPLETLILMMCSSIIIGTILGSIFGYKSIKPIQEISDATKKIAEGNYQVKIDEIPLTSHDGELNQLIDNFNHMAAKLAQTETLRSDFIANVSHEFKTPLATIEGYVTLLEDDTLTEEERKKYRKIIFDATKKLSALSSNILKISKLDNQEVEINLKEYDVSEQIREVIILQESAWTAKNINLDLDLPEITIYSDEELLQQVWMNIISNAIKFSNDGGTIHVKVKSNDYEVKVIIKDEGIGMSEETKSRMFDKFYQGDTSHQKEGNGLGMALSQKIVKLCQGKIIVDSAINEGTTIEVNLPLIVKETKE